MSERNRARPTEGGVIEEEGELLIWVKDRKRKRYGPCRCWIRNPDRCKFMNCGNLHLESLNGEIYLIRKVNEGEK